MYTQLLYIVTGLAAQETYVAGEGDGGGNARERAGVGALVRDEGLEGFCLSHLASIQQSDFTSCHHRDVDTW